MKLTTATLSATLAAAFGLLSAASSAYAQRFKLPACANACVALNPTCDTTGTFCNSVCFGPCLQQGCRTGADQQRLISACAKPFESSLIAPAATSTPATAVTTTRRPAQTPSSPAAADSATLGTGDDGAGDASSVGSLEPSASTGTKALSQPMNTIPINGTSKNSSSTMPQSNSTSTNSTGESGEAEDTPASDSGAGRVIAGAFSIGLAFAFVGLILLI